MRMRFTWDETKNRSNLKKHGGIAFEEAAYVFRDPFRLTRQDRIEGGEERWQTIGVVYGVCCRTVLNPTLSSFRPPVLPCE